VLGHRCRLCGTKYACHDVVTVVLLKDMPFYRENQNYFYQQNALIYFSAASYSCSRHKRIFYQILFFRRNFKSRTFML